MKYYIHLFLQNPYNFDVQKFQINVKLQGVHQNSLHFVFYNFSAPLTAWIKRKDIFEMPFKFSVGKSQKTLSELTIWTRYYQKC